MVFEDTSGWGVSDTNDASTAVSLTEDLSDTSNNAKLLRNTYIYKYWFKNVA